MMEIQNLISDINHAINDYEKSLQHLTQLEKDIHNNRDLYEEVSQDIELFEKVRVFLQELAEITRAEIASGLEHIVTLCLQAVFGPTMSFEIEINTSRNNTIVDFFVVDAEGEHVVRDSPENSMGGGVVDTVAIGLRFGLLKILKPEPKGAIILDEPAKMVSANLIGSVSELLQELTHMFGKQTILITHHTSLMDIVDNSIYLEKVNGTTQVVTSKRG